jgi:hypothetical protein
MNNRWAEFENASRLLICHVLTSPITVQKSIQLCMANWAVFPEEAEVGLPDGQKLLVDAQATLGLQPRRINCQSFPQKSG